MRSHRHLAAALLALLSAALPSCSCERALSRNVGVAVLVDPVVDFGDVQVNLEHAATLRIRNDGSAPLTLSEPVVTAPFGLRTQLPLTLFTGEEASLEVTFLPTAVGAQVEGTLSVTTDDPENLAPVATLKGRGITAAALFSARPLDFGDVFAGESKQVTLKVTNAGSAALKVLSVEPLPGTTGAPHLAYDLQPFRADIPAGASAEVAFTFTPKAMLALAGGLKFTFDPLQGGEQEVAFAGRGIQGIPALCFRFDGAGTEQCTAITAAQQFESVTVNFGPLCDSSAYPVGTDGGCTAENSARAAQVYVKNAGNTPVKYTVKYTAFANANPDPCDAGTPALPDFQFSNAPDAVTYEWTAPQVQLPEVATATPPWESAPVTLTYRPTARCVAEGADQARVMLMRQGDGAQAGVRLPQTVTAFVQGASALPNLQPAASSCGAVGAAQSVPCEMDFYGVINQGSWPASLEEVAFYEEVDGGLVPCTAGSPAGSPCHRFSWADGGTPQLPVVLGPAAGTPPVGTRVKLGRIVFGAQPGDVVPNQLYRVYAVTRSDDPFRPEVQSKVEGVGAP
jgi:hypothetical protein